MQYVPLLVLVLAVIATVIAARAAGWRVAVYVASAGLLLFMTTAVAASVRTLSPDGLRRVHRAQVAAALHHRYGIRLDSATVARLPDVTGSATPGVALTVSGTPRLCTVSVQSRFTDPSVACATDTPK